MKEFKKVNIDKIILVIVVVLTFFRIVLAVNTPVGIATDQTYDDNLLYNYSINLSNGNWLGEYSQLTLSKGISYSLFIALNEKLMIPYSLALILLYVFATVIFCYSFKSIINKRYLAFMYLLILYSPVMMTSLISQRVYRNAILPSASLLAFGSFIGLYLNSENGGKILGWSIISAISLSFFWFIKEDSIWILPFVCLSSLITLINLFKLHKETFFKNLLIVMIPIAVLLINVNLISYMNYSHYGVYMVSDKSYGQFSSMMKKMFKIDDNKSKNSNIWLTSATLNKLYEISPTFSKIKSTMNSTTSWTENGEVKGDYIIWKIRYSMEKNGFYSDAKTAQEFCKSVSNDIDKAISDGTISYDNKIHISAQMRGIDYDDIENSFPKTINLLKDISNYDSTGVSLYYSSGESLYVKKVQAYLESIILYDNSFQIEMAKKPIRISNCIVNIYKKIGNILSIIVIFLVFFNIIFMIIMKKYAKCNHFIEFNLILLGIILSALLILFEINLFTGFFDDSMYQNFKYFYSASAYPLVQTFKYIVIYFAGINILKLKKEMRLY